MRKGWWIAALGLGLLGLPTLSLWDELPSLPSLPAFLPGVEAPEKRADFADERPSREAREVADWVLDSHDHQGRPFAIVDKAEARVHVFAPDGRLRGSAPVLLGAARGDDSVPGIGERPIAEILPHERTTPAGRFETRPGRNLEGEDILWVSYEDAVSMHRVRAHKLSERRLERLASPTADDNRISYGCINVPAAFYDSVLAPLLGASRGIVYVLPETRPAWQVFGSRPIEARPRVPLSQALAAPAAVTGEDRQR